MELYIGVHLPALHLLHFSPTYDGPGVFIRQVDVSSPEVLERLTADVLTEFPEEITNFQAIYAFIATWRQTSVYEGDDTEV